MGSDHVVNVHPDWAAKACKAAMRAGSVAAAIRLAINWHSAGDSVVDVVDEVLVEEVLVDEVLVVEEELVLVLDEVVVFDDVGVVQAALY